MIGNFTSQRVSFVSKFLNYNASVGYFEYATTLRVDGIIYIVSFYESDRPSKRSRRPTYTVD